MRLYWHPFSIFPRRVRIALREKGLECEEVLVDLPGGALKTDAFLALNPFGQVPVLEDEGLVLCESVAILEYLEDRYRTPPLLPASLRDRALARQWMQCSGDYLTPPFKRWLRPFLAPTEPRDRGDESRAASEIGAHLDVLERALREREYLAGDFSLADTCYVPFVCELGSVGLAELLSPRSRVHAWIDRLRARASVAATTPGP